MVKNSEINRPKQAIRNIGFIMDGNRRYAMKNSISLQEAYTRGAQVFFNVIQLCIENKINSAAFYALSYDNMMKREKQELDSIYEVVFREIEKKKDFLLEYGVKLRFVGVLNKLSERLTKEMKRLESLTDSVKQVFITVFVLSAYDPKIDLSLLCNLTAKTTEGVVSSLDIADMDLIIRTGGNNRLSGFLPAQSTYADLVTIEAFWPELQEKKIKDIFLTYRENSKGYGK